jgi:hypothetical protein
MRRRILQLSRLLLTALLLVGGCARDLLLDLRATATTSAGTESLAGKPDAGSATGGLPAEGGSIAGAAGEPAIGGASGDAGAAGVGPTGGVDLGSCSSDDECAHNSTEQICHPSRLLCVQCLSDFECDNSRTCDQNLGRCVARCTEDGDVACGGDTRYCNVQLQFCVECVTNDECPTATPWCINACVQCTTDTDCGSDHPHCWQQRNRCVDCMNDSDCGSGACTAKHDCQP